MRTYIGRNGHDVVIREGALLLGRLPLRLDLRNHSPTGFSWGYQGSGPSQLALAILADHFRGCEDGEERALDLYQQYKRIVVAALPREWEISSQDIEDAVVEIQARMLERDAR